MTGTPRATASLIAPVTLPASEQEMSTALAPSLTACAMRCAWTWPSSGGGVSQTISIGTLCFCDSSFAAASAPVRADRNTGLVELLAIIAIFSPRCPAGAAPVDGVLDSRPPHAVSASGMTKSAVTIVRREQRGLGHGFSVRRIAQMVSD